MIASHALKPHLALLESARADVIEAVLHMNRAADQMTSVGIDVDATSQPLAAMLSIMLDLDGLIYAVKNLGDEQ